MMLLIKSTAKSAKWKMINKFWRNKQMMQLWNSVRSSINTTKRVFSTKNAKLKFKTTKRKSPKKIILWKACSANSKKKRKEELTWEPESNLTWPICLEAPIFPKPKRPFSNIKPRLLTDSNTISRPKSFTSTTYRIGPMMQKRINFPIQTFTEWPIINSWRFCQRSFTPSLKQTFLVKTILS